MTKIIPVLLCGGSGTRLWPLSRKSFPKQFTALSGDGSLFSQTLQRLTGPDFEAPVIVTNSDFRFIVTEQAAAAGLTPQTILIEPEGRNTAPAVLAAALCHEASPDALMLVAPSDHVIPDTKAFHAALVPASAAAAAGRIVTFGIRPTRPETGYGWLELAPDTPADAVVADLLRFVEKPDAARAAAMLDAGGYLWNAGIFLFRVGTMLDAFAAHAPAMIAPVRAALDGAARDLGFLRLDPAAWSGAEATSLDYAVMEHAPDLAVVPFDGGWSDLGDWDAVWRETAEGPAGNATHGAVTALDCDNSILRAEGEGQVLVGIGLSDMIAVAMPDAVLVAPRARAQEVKEAVAALRATSQRQAETFPRDHRPWGWFETLALGDRFQVKRIVVHPGGALSLQSHVHRAEHWIVVKGTARVTIGDAVHLVTENQSVYIPLGEKHRLENPGRVPMVLIEVQTGTYLGEDDITRYDDVYARGQGAKG